MCLTGAADICGSTGEVDDVTAVFFHIGENSFVGKEGSVNVYCENFFEICKSDKFCGAVRTNTRGMNKNIDSAEIFSCFSNAFFYFFFIFSKNAGRFPTY